MEDRQQHQTKQSWLAPAFAGDYAAAVCGAAGDGCFCHLVDTMRRQQYGVAMPALFGAVWDRRSGFCPTAQKSVFDFGRYRADICRAAWLACLSAGYNGWQNPIYDLTNYIRVVQIPLFTLCFITFLRETGEGGYQTVDAALSSILD